MYTLVLSRSIQNIDTRRAEEGSVEAAQGRKFVRIRPAPWVSRRTALSVHQVRVTKNAARDHEWQENLKRRVVSWAFQRFIV